MTEAQVLVGRCVSYGEGATYLPIAEIVRQATAEPSLDGIRELLDGEEDAESVAQRVAELIGVAESPAAPGEAFWAVRRLLESIARKGPVVVALDDIHWAEPTLLDLVEYLGEWAEGPILVVCLARADLLDARPGWGGPTSTGFLVRLEPLPEETLGAFVEQLAGRPVDPQVQERIIEQSGGNPLFAEQLLALVQEAPELALDKTPATVEALLASRLDRLDPRELRVIRRAAVVGRRFTRAELDDLSRGRRRRSTPGDASPNEVLCVPCRTSSASTMCSCATSRIAASRKPSAPSYTSWRARASIAATVRTSWSATTSSRRTGT